MALKSSTKESLAGYGFLLPNFLGFLAFTLVPVIVSLTLAFTKWDLISGPPEFVGFHNFVEMFHSPKFRYYCYNTVYLMAAVPLSMAGSLILALALNEKLRGVVFFRTLYFLPTISAGVAIYVLWRLMIFPMLLPPVYPTLWTIWRKWKRPAK